MRCSGWSSLAISVCSALGLAGAADAHVIVAPAFLGAESDATLSLTAPNERDEPMTGFAVTVPSGFEIVHAHPTQGWEGDVQGATASWTGGSLEPGTEATFGLALQAPPAPGAVELQAEQRYPGGETVRWPVALTVTPAADSSSRTSAWQPSWDFWACSGLRRSGRFSGGGAAAHFKRNSGARC